MLVLLLVAFATANAATITEPAVPTPWMNTDVNRAVGTVKISFAIKEQGIDEIKRVALAVSDPTSATYGQHLSVAEIDAITRPLAADLMAVTAWLGKDRTTTVEKARTVSLTCTVAEAEELLQTSFRTVHNPRTGQSALRAGAVHVPEDVRAAIAAVYGIWGLPLPPKEKQRAPAVTRRLQPSQTAVTPADLRASYSVEGVKPTGSTANRQAVAEFQGQAMRPADLTTFFSKYVTNYTVGVDDVVFAFQGDSGGNQDFPGVEASLDIQYIMGVAPKIKTEFWYYYSNDFCADMKKPVKLLQCTLHTQVATT